MRSPPFDDSAGAFPSLAGTEINGNGSFAKKTTLEKELNTLIRLPECPICHKPVAPVTDPTSSYAPFCSRRCKEVDLIRWCEGRYAIVETVDPSRRTEDPLDGRESELDEDNFSEESVEQRDH